MRGSAAPCTSLATCSATSPAPSSRWSPPRLRAIFRAAHGVEAHQALGDVVERLAVPAPKVARLLEAAESDLLAFYAFLGRV